MAARAEARSRPRQCWLAGLRPSSVCLLVLAALHGSEPAPDPSPAPSEDPSLAVVAEGRWIYRRRDVEALALVAARHLNRPLSESDRETLTAIMAQALVAREALLESVDAIPGGIEGQARQRLLLDLLAYEGEVPAEAPSLVETPALSLVRQLGDLGRYRLELSLALRVRDRAAAEALSTRGPELRAALLDCLAALEPELFVNPNLAELRLRIHAALIPLNASLGEGDVLITAVSSEPNPAVPAE